MPNFNIHWSGYPHHRLPRIRVVSTRHKSVHNRLLSGSGQTSRVQSHIKSEKENKKSPFRIQFRRQRMRGSRASSSILRARRRASVRARHNIQVFGWDTPGAELASRVTEKSGSGSRPTKPRSISGATLRPEIQESSAIPSTDGAASSVARRLNPRKKQSENAYSLRHIAKVPVYWTADHPSKADKASYNPDRLYSAQRSGPLQAASNQISSHRPTERTRSYDTRFETLGPIASQRRRLSPRPQFKPNTFRRATSQVSPTRKDTGTEFWEAVRKYSQQSRLQGKPPASIKSIVHSLVSETASRSPSQKKVLARFTKGIELYLQAAKEHPSQSLVSSLSTRSTTSLSAYTIQELKPYQSEFRSAGLAITAAEQKGMAKLQKGPTPPPTPPKDDKYVKNETPPKKKNNNQQLGQKTKLPSYASGSTGTTILGWTPPHEKTYGRPSTKDRTSSSISTDQTIIGFTPHEKDASPPRPLREAPATPRASMKKSLPWLRKPEASPESSPTNELKSASVMHEQHRPSTPLGGWVSTFDVAEPTKPGRESQSVGQSRPGISQRPTNATRDDPRYSARNSTATNYMNQVVDEMAQTQVNPDESLEPSRPNNVYVHIGTQTVAFSPTTSRQDTINDNQAERQLYIDRAPVSSIRSKTFPLKSKNCNGDCAQPSAEPFPSATQQRSSRPSKVMWKGVDQDSQVTMEDPEPRHMTESDAIQDQPSFRSYALPGERTRTFPLATTPTKRIGPYQAPPNSRSPNKSKDAGTSTWAQNDEEQYEVEQTNSETSLIGPTSRHSIPPLCTQCSGPLNSTLATEPSPKADSQLLSPVHACTARSSTQCQQCFPSRNSSIAISPLQGTFPAEVRAPIEVQYLPSRRSTRPIIPAGPFEYAEETPSPADAECIVVDTPKMCSTSERKRTQSKIEHSLVETPKSCHSPNGKRPQSLAELAIEEYTKQEPMADPMKRPSLPRLKLRPVASEPTKHVHCYSTISRPKTVPQMPKIPQVDPPACLAFASTTSTDSCSVKTGEINEKQVFKGLHVATAAACDEDVDKWIEEITGSSARRFLSALSAFDGLGVNTLAGVARRAAKQRRDKLNAWEALREKRMAEHDPKPRCELEDCDGVEYMLGDQDIGLGSKCAQKNSFGDRDGGDEYMAYDQGVKKQCDELKNSMLKRRECKGSEGIKERAVRMGWRDRSISGGV
ncbi:hypothetical protein ONS96_007576 [Cadophora gregata f. sp. sojae]|nr:hypothetical protein ONS96_007576 [Cadophora gregata f. sp. sojae]